MTQVNKCHLQLEVAYGEDLDLCIGCVSSAGQNYCCHINELFRDASLPVLCLISPLLVKC